jgi:hypothetical protein
MQLTPEDDALVQGLFDGALTAGDRDAAERLVQSNADARQRAAELSELGRLLEALGPTEPPVDFSKQVMRAVGNSHAHVELNRTLPASGQQLTFGERLSQLLDGGFGMGKKVMWGMVATAFAALVVMKVVGYPPIDGAQGTVGAAKRYQADQIAPADVKVDDSAQAFLQSDVFDQLMKDPDARQMLASPSFRSALATPEFRLALANADFSKALASADFRLALANADFSKALASADFRNALANSNFSKAQGNADFSKALANADFAKALASAGFRQALANADFAKALASADFARALASADFVRALASPGMAAALASPNFAKALASPGFVHALSSAQMSQALAAVKQ